MRKKFSTADSRACVGTWPTMMSHAGTRGHCSRGQFPRQRNALSVNGFHCAPRVCFAIMPLRTGTVLSCHDSAANERCCMARLGVNIDHVATLRQARGGHEPDPVAAAVLADLGGADSLVVHLREDRRHIQEQDLTRLRETVPSALNLEMAAEDTMTNIALRVRPDQVTLVPEQRQELTTEGGLAVTDHEDRLALLISRLHDARIPVSLFIDPDPSHIRAAGRVGADAIELHTGHYANSHHPSDIQEAVQSLIQGADLARQLGLEVHAGHGLTYHNIRRLTSINEIVEFNIGHSIISRAVLVGLERAVREMRACIPFSSSR